MRKECSGSFVLLFYYGSWNETRPARTDPHSDAGIRGAAAVLRDKTRRAARAVDVLFGSALFIVDASACDKDADGTGDDGTCMRASAGATWAGAAAKGHVARGLQAGVKCRGTDAQCSSGTGSHGCEVSGKPLTGTDGTAEPIPPPGLRTCSSLQVEGGSTEHSVSVISHGDSCIHVHGRRGWAPTASASLARP